LYRLHACYAVLVPRLTEFVTVHRGLKLVYCSDWSRSFTASSYMYPMLSKSSIKRRIYKITLRYASDGRQLYARGTCPWYIVSSIPEDSTPIYPVPTIVPYPLTRWRPSSMRSVRNTRIRSTRIAYIDLINTISSTIPSNRTSNNMDFVRPT
jgi:hypothetical protein